MKARGVMGSGGEWGRVKRNGGELRGVKGSGGEWGRVKRSEGELRGVEGWKKMSI